MSRRSRTGAVAWLAAACLVGLSPGLALVAPRQLADSVIEPEHPAIAYGGPTTDHVASLNRRLQVGEVRLEYAERTGYLSSLLAALDIQVDSQLALFSGTSLQARLINARNPRTLFFNDSTAVAWMSGGFIEVATFDARQGAVFYLLAQSRAPTPQLVRDTRCLQCHYSTATLGVPGFLVRSIPSAADGTILPWLGNYTTDHRSPIEERWGGWYVTGRGGGRHLGNAPIADRSLQDLRIDDRNLEVSSLADRFDTRSYLSPYSDMAALLVFDHQMQMLNLLTRIGWDTRILEHDRRAAVAAALRPAAVEVVDYMLFVDEAPLQRVQGTSGFTERFSSLGPRDTRGRSLRQLDLERRLLRYPCSYMIYSEAFDALPPAAKDAIYLRLWEVLSGRETATRYARLSSDDRQAVLEILRDTKRDLPPAFSLPPSRP
jgi:hypothetical protein